jgi:hypothetical protein
MTTQLSCCESVSDALANYLKAEAITVSNTITAITVEFAPLFIACGTMECDASNYPGLGQPIYTANLVDTSAPVPPLVVPDIVNRQQIRIGVYTEAVTCLNQQVYKSLSKASSCDTSCCQQALELVKVSLSTLDMISNVATNPQIMELQAGTDPNTETVSNGLLPSFCPSNSVGSELAGVIYFFLKNNKTALDALLKACCSQCIEESSSTSCSSSSSSSSCRPCKEKFKKKSKKSKKNKLC